jgi:hypothetical protein
MSENPLLNPLKKIPGISVTLPSRALLYDQGEVDEDVIRNGGEVHVRPLSSRDELIMRSADLILNGKAFEYVCKNCVDGINKPLDLFQIDHDSLLVAFRIATFGEAYPIIVQNEKHDPKKAGSRKELNFDVNLKKLLQEQKALEGSIEDYQVKIESTEQTVTIQPLRLRVSLELIRRQLEESTVNAAKREGFNDRFNPDLDVEEWEEALEKFTLRRLSESTNKTVEESVEKSELVFLSQIRDVNEIHDLSMVKEWYDKLPASDFYPVKEAIDKRLDDLGINQVIEINDPSTKTSFKTVLPINPMDFFVSGPKGMTLKA